MDPSISKKELQCALFVRAGIPTTGPWMTDSQQQQMKQSSDNIAWNVNESFPQLMRRLMLREKPSMVSQDQFDMIRNALETPSITAVFSSSVEAALLAGFMVEADTTTGWASDDPIKSLKTQERLRFEAASGLEVTPRGQTAKCYDPKFFQETYSAVRFAKKIEVDDQDILDDNFNALTAIPMEMGKAARRLRPDLVYSELLFNPELSDGVTLFHANRGNYDTGAALSETTLEAGMAAMQNQQENGVSLNIKPKYLLVPPSLGVTARKVVRSLKLDDPEYDLQVRTEARLENGVADPRLPGATHAGSSTTWYLAASGAHAPSILFGARTERPVVRSFSFDSGKWGTCHDINWDCGALAMSHLGLYRADA